MFKWGITAAMVWAAVFLSMGVTSGSAVAQAAGPASLLPQLEELSDTLVQKAHSYHGCRYGHRHWSVRESYRCCKRWGYNYGNKYCRSWGTCYRSVSKWGCNSGGGGGY
jgi:hypothetical protein